MALSLKMNFLVFLALLVVVFTFFTAMQFAFFVSFRLALFSTHSSAEHFRSTGYCVAWNVCLVLLFAVQHSLQKKLKSFFARHEGEVSGRLLYNIGTCIALQILMLFWQPIDWIMWEVPGSISQVLKCFNVIAWMTILGGGYMMDMAELLGTKQVFYAIQELPDPLSQKSEELRRFYSHMRHPGATAFVVVLFAQPVMRLDRLLLAVSLLLYIVLRCRVDVHDYAYQERLLRRKERDLNELVRGAIN